MTASEQHLLFNKLSCVSFVFEGNQELSWELKQSIFLCTPAEESTTPIIHVKCTTQHWHLQGAHHSLMLLSFTKLLFLLVYPSSHPHHVKWKFDSAEYPKTCLPETEDKLEDSKTGEL